MKLPCKFLVSRGEIVVRGVVPAEHLSGCTEVLLTIGRRRLSAKPAVDGTYCFAFASRRRLLWGRISTTDVRGLTRRLHDILIWKRPALPAPPPPDPVIEALRLITDGAFDASFYLSHLPENQRGPAAHDPLGHYLSTGWKQGFAPHRWFDPDWYLRENPALVPSGQEPFSHYLSEGWKHERHPHPGFDNTFYLSRHPELMLGEKSPLHHWNLHASPADVRAYVPHPASGPSDFSSARPYPHADPETMRARVDAYRRERKPGNTVAFLTCITGDYDTLRLPEHLSPEIDYHVFSDRPVPSYGVFHVHQLDLPRLTDLTRRARYAKLHSHVLLPGYDTVIFGDANIVIRGDFMAHVRRFRESGLPLAFVPHPARNCLYEEAVICVAGNRDTAERIVPQMLAYRREGFPAAAGMSESNLFACRPADPSARVFFEAWWAQLENGSRRDQLSAHYVVWKLALKIHPFLGPGFNTRNHPDTALVSHGTYDAPAFAHLAAEPPPSGA